MSSICALATSVRSVMAVTAGAATCASSVASCQSGKPVSVESLVTKHLGLVKIIAMGIRARLPQFVDLEDLMQAGTLGLVDAARKFSPEKETTFSTYAKHRIRGAILDSLRQCDNASRQTRRWQRRVDAATTKLSAKLQRAPEEAEIAQELEVAVERLRAIVVQIRGLETVSVSSRPGEELPDIEFPTEPEEQPDLIYAKKELRGALAAAVNELPPRHQSVLRLYYMGGMTMREIGKRMGVNESRVSQIHKFALGRLGDRLRANNVTSTAAF